MNNNKSILVGVIVAVVVLGGMYFLQKQSNEATSPKEAKYLIDGRYIKLNNGVSEIESDADSSSKITTQYFGNEVMHDLDGDGREDTVFLLTQNQGGSGTFFYVVAALNKEDGYVGSEALLLGDRIAPQTTEMGKGNIIIVNYADRKPGEPFTADPSVGKSIWLLLDPETLQFGEVLQNFEGEADPDRMTLPMKTWNWVNALYNDGREITPKQPNKFSITFSDAGKFVATTDCNSMGGNYTSTKDTISFSSIVSTKMFCEGSQEGDFASLLENASGYHFTSRGELILDLKFDSGSVVFR